MIRQQYNVAKVKPLCICLSNIIIFYFKYIFGKKYIVIKKEFFGVFVKFRIKFLFDFVFSITGRQLLVL